MKVFGFPYITNFENQYGRSTRMLTATRTIVCCGFRSSFYSESIYISVIHFKAFLK